MIMVGLSLYYLFLKKKFGLVVGQLLREYLCDAQEVAKMIAMMPTMMMRKSMLNVFMTKFLVNTTDNNNSGFEYSILIS